MAEKSQTAGYMDAIRRQGTERREREAAERKVPPIGELEVSNALTAATHRADQAEALNAELAAALRGLVATVEDECAALELEDAAIALAKRVLTYTPAAAAERVAAMEAAADVLRAVQYSDPYDKCVGCGAYAGLEENEPCKPECPVSAALARLDAAGRDG